MSNFPLNSELVRRYLIRALTGDTERPRPPITLAGQRTDSAPQPIPPPPAATPPIWTRPSHDRRRDRTRSSHAEPEPGDEVGPYTYEELMRMDNRFRARLLRAFKRGKESRQAAAYRIAAPRW
jgi:hypothetical protein